MESRTKNSKRNIIIGIFSSLIIPICGFFVRSAIVQHLGEDYLGLTSFMTSVFQVLNLAELGFSSAVIVNLYKPISENDQPTVRAILAYYRKAYKIIGIVIVVAGLLIMPFLTKLAGENSIKDNLYVIYIIYLLNTGISYYLFSYKEALLNAIQRFDITKKLYTILYVLKSVLQFAAVVLYKNFYLYALIMLISTIMYNLALQYFSKKQFPEYFPEGKLNNEVKGSIKEQIVGLSISKVLDVARNSLDSIILTAFLGLATTGIYNNYYYIHSALIGLMWMIITSIQASVGNSIVTEQREKNFRDLVKFEFLYNIIITALTVYLLCLYQPIMKLWMGKELLLENLDMILFVIYFYTLTISGVRNAYFNALGLWWKGRWIAIAESTSNLILNIVLGKLFGVTGILLATIITMVLMNYILFTNLLFKEYFKNGIITFYKDRIIYSIITGVICVISVLLCNKIEAEGILEILLKAIISTVVMGTIYPFFCYLVKKSLFKESISFIRSVIRLR